MSRAMIVIRNDVDRARAARWAHKAPVGTRVEFKAARRTLAQNDKLWACLTDVAQQVRWHGLKLRPDDFKLIFMDALKRERRAVLNLDGTGFVDLSSSSRDLSKAEMSDLIELITAWGAQNGVTFNDQGDAPDSEAA